MKIDVNVQYVMFFLICSSVLFGFYYRWKRSHSHISAPEDRQDVFIMIIFALAGMAIFLYPCILYGMKISYTKFNYITPPFSHLGVKTAGPELSDVADQNLPYFWKTYIQHELTFWNEDVAFGTQTDLFFVLNPLNWVFLLGMELGQLLKAILKYTISFMGLFLFLRRCRLSRTSAFIGAISYGFCSVMVMWNGWPHSDVMAFGPWLFFFAESLLLDYYNKSHMRIGYCIGFTIILYFMLVSGMPTYVPFFLYAGLAYVLLRSNQLFNPRIEAKKIMTVLSILIVCIVISGLMSFAYTGTVFLAQKNTSRRECRFLLLHCQSSIFVLCFFHITEMA